MSTYPVNAPEVTAFLRRGAPTSDWFVRFVDNTGDFYTWDDAFGPQPSVSEVLVASGDGTIVEGQTFSEWWAENGGDPTLTRRRQAKNDTVDGESFNSVAYRAELGERNRADVELAQRVNEIQAALLAIKNSVGDAQAIRDALPSVWTQAEIRTREDARADVKEDIDSGNADS